MLQLLRNWLACKKELAAAKALRKANRLRDRAATAVGAATPTADANAPGGGDNEDVLGVAEDSVVEQDAKEHDGEGHHCERTKSARQMPR